MAVVKRAAMDTVVPICLLDPAFNSLGCTSQSEVVGCCGISIYAMEALGDPVLFFLSRYTNVITPFTVENVLLCFIFLRVRVSSQPLFQTGALKVLRLLT